MNILNLVRSVIAALPIKAEARPEAVLNIGSGHRSAAGTPQ